MGDFVAGVLNFEGKFWRTLPMLAWCPGILTRRYIEGQRARFISPIALFLFSVFLLFATIQLIGGPSGMNQLTAGGGTYHSTDEAIAGEKAKLARLEAKRAKARCRGDRRSSTATSPTSASQWPRWSGSGAKAWSMPSLPTARHVNVRSSVPMVNDAIKRAKANPQLAIYRLQDAASKYALGADPDLRAVPVAAVPV